MLLVPSQLLGGSGFAVVSAGGGSSGARLTKDCAGSGPRRAAVVASRAIASVSGSGQRKTLGVLDRQFVESARGSISARSNYLALAPVSYLARARESMAASSSLFEVFQLFVAEVLQIVVGETGQPIGRCRGHFWRAASRSSIVSILSWACMTGS